MVRKMLRRVNESKPHVFLSTTSALEPEDVYHLSVTLPLPWPRSQPRTPHLEAQLTLRSA